MSWLRDPRDLAFIRLTLRASALLLPPATAMFFAPPWLVWTVALPYLWLLYAVLGGPVLLMVHALTHRPSFHGRGVWLRRYICHCLPLVYGLSPFAYRPHHLVMHHAEENRQEDLSSTLRYTRDRWSDFARYYLRFLLCGNFQLARYLRSRAQTRERRRFVAGETCHLAVMLLLVWQAPAAALVVCVLPYALTRFFLMAGNWAQHAFVDLTALDDGVRNATILTNARHNRRCFNDGYHALHHRWPGLHWAEMSASYQADWRTYAENRVIVFDGIPSNQVVWWRLMRKDYGYFADHMLDLGVLPVARAERIAFLQQRVRARVAAGVRAGEYL